jgi:DNA-binding transcriptional regulator YbjK
MTQPLTDKGRARRRAIVVAAADLLLDGGPPAVTHRAVAQRAGVSLGSTTYYFADRDELLAAAADHARASDVERARLAAAAPPPGRGRRGLAAHLVDVVVGRERLDDPDRVAARYLRFLSTPRTAAGRTGLARWHVDLRDVVGDLLERHKRPGAAADVVLAVVDGCVLAWLAAGEGADGLVERVRSGLGRLDVAPTPGESPGGEPPPGDGPAGESPAAGTGTP